MEFLIESPIQENERKLIYVLDKVDIPYDTYTSIPFTDTVPIISEFPTFVYFQFRYKIPIYTFQRELMPCPPRAIF